MRNIEHYQPEETNEKGEGYFHKLDLIVDGENIGKAELFYKNSPFPFYYLSWIDINPEKRGAGHGKNFLAAINQFLDSKGKSGLLTNSIHNESPAHSMYQNNGWQEIANHQGWYIYNPPKNLFPDRVDKAIHEVRQMME